jgi:NAD+ synthase (glutamine-hydrolysing)
LWLRPALAGSNRDAVVHFSSMTLSICTAQLNFVVGDMPGNAQKIVSAARAAYAQGARLLLTPELAICGYAAEDLFLRPAFMTACDDAVKTVARETAGLKGLVIVLGHPQAIGPDAPAFSACFNAASVVRDGRIEQTYVKRELPNYLVFDERRYFVPGTSPCVFDVDGVRIGLLICEDAWFPGPARETAAAGSECFRDGRTADHDRPAWPHAHQCGGLVGRLAVDRLRHAVRCRWSSVRRHAN